MPEHISVLCTDGVVRRFYQDPSARPYTEGLFGHVKFADADVFGIAHAIEGELNRHFTPGDKNAFISIPKTIKWQPSHKCCALKYCLRAGMCKGGCR